MNYSKKEREDLFFNIYWEQRHQWAINKVKNGGDVTDNEWDNFETSIPLDMFICTKRTILNHLKELGYTYKYEKMENLIYFKRRLK